MSFRLSSLSFYINRSIGFIFNSIDDLTISSSTVACTDPTYNSPMLSCSSGCTGDYLIPLSCPICSPASALLSTCGTCPQGSYGGGNVSCQLCPIGYSTLYPNCTSISQCVPITNEVSDPVSSPIISHTSFPLLVRASCILSTELYADSYSVTYASIVRPAFLDA